MNLKPLNKLLNNILFEGYINRYIVFIFPTKEAGFIGEDAVSQRFGFENNCKIGEDCKLTSV